MNKINAEGLNADVKQWSKQSAVMMKGKVRLLTNKNKHQFLKARKEGKTLEKSIKHRNPQRFGLVRKVVFSFERQGVFIAYGVSRGHKKSNPRKIIDWFQSVLDVSEKSLADIVVEHYADAAIKAYSFENNIKA